MFFSSQLSSAINHRVVRLSIVTLSKTKRMYRQKQYSAFEYNKKYQFGKKLKLSLNTKKEGIPVRHKYLCG
jgi:hypothetical protein